MSQESSPVPTKAIAIVTLSVLTALGSIYLYGLNGSSLLRESVPLANNSSTSSEGSLPTIEAVSALGRLEPEGEIIQLSAPASLDGTTTRVEQLTVELGSQVEEGQSVAVLDSYQSRKAALEQAMTAINVAKAELRRVEAGAATGDLEAQRSTVSRYEAELNNARSEYERFDSLYQSGAISAIERDQKKLLVETAQAQLNQARSSLNSLAEVRSVDISVARANVDNAEAAASRAAAELEMTVVVAPTSGQVLKIHTQPGETISPNGILEMAQTDQMVVVAEVYETDIERVKVGQSAIITSGATDGKLQGVVSEIGLQVSPQEAFSVDPTANTDNRIIEVTVQLDKESSQAVRNLSNLQVQVVIQV